MSESGSVYGGTRRFLFLFRRRIMWLGKQIVHQGMPVDCEPARRERDQQIANHMQGGWVDCSQQCHLGARGPHPRARARPVLRLPYSLARQVLLFTACLGCILKCVRSTVLAESDWIGRFGTLLASVVATHADVACREVLYFLCPPNTILVRLVAQA